MTPNRCGVLFVRKYRLALFYLYSIKRELKVVKNYKYFEASKFNF
jgi:hypothetical protein